MSSTSLHTSIAPHAGRQHPGSSDSARLMALDGLRGLAIAFVLMTHAWERQFPGGGIVGVDLFFGLSGFLITRVLLRSSGHSLPWRLRSFYVARAYRLLPALYAMLVLYVLVVLAFGRSLHRPLGTSIASVGYAALYVYNLVSVLGLQWSADLGPLWTLATEEQFYVVWPFVLFFLMTCVRSTRRRLVTLVTLAVVIWVLRAVSFGLVGTEIYVLPTTWADTLVLGGVVGLLSTDPRIMRRVSVHASRLRPLSTVTMMLLVLLVFAPGLKGRALTYEVVLPICSALIPVIVLLVSANLVGSRLTALLTSRPVVALGGVSYSAYLYNYPCCQLLRERLGDGPLIGGIAVLLTLVLAGVSRRWIELPLLRLRSRRSQARDRAGLPATAPSVV